MSIHRSPVLTQSDGFFRDNNFKGWICASELREQLNIPAGARIRLVASTKKTYGAFRLHLDGVTARWRVNRWRVNRMRPFLVWDLRKWLHSLPAPVLWCWVELE